MRQTVFEIRPATRFLELISNLNIRTKNGFGAIDSWESEECKYRGYIIPKKNGKLFLRYLIFIRVLFLSQNTVSQIGIFPSCVIDSLDINFLHFRAEIPVDRTFAQVMQHRASLFLRLKNLFIYFSQKCPFSLQNLWKKNRKIFEKFEP